MLLTLPLALCRQSSWPRRPGSECAEPLSRYPVRQTKLRAVVSNAPCNRYPNAECLSFFGVPKPPLVTGREIYIQVAKLNPLLSLRSSERWSTFLVVQSGATRREHRQPETFGRQVWPSGRSRSPGNGTAGRTAGTTFGWGHHRPVGGTRYVPSGSSNEPPRPARVALFGQSVTGLDRKEEPRSAGDRRTETGDVTAPTGFRVSWCSGAFGRRCAPVKESFGATSPATRQPRVGEDFGRNLVGVSRVLTSTEPRCQ